MDIISRSEWGARPWNGQPYDAEMHERTHFLVHYHGGSDPNDQYGDAYPREIERGHLANGWSGIGYNFVVSQDGTIYEGRGWNLVGAHCPGKNRTGIGVQIGIGGDTEPTDAAKLSVLWLYAEAERRAGHSLTTGVHGDYYATLCAGNPTDRWVHSGMPAPSSGGTQDVPVLEPITPSTPPGRGKIAEDGVLGPATYRALQRKVGADVDGIWGDQTRRRLQRFLRVSVDGIIGPESVRALQAWVGTTQDGIWGRATTLGLQRALNDDKPRPRGRVFKRKPKPTGGPLLQVGSTGRRVRRLQKGLNRAFPAYADLTVDGIFGGATAAAVREFQERSNLTPDGVVGAKTRAALARHGIKP